MECNNSILRLLEGKTPPDHESVICGTRQMGCLLEGKTPLSLGGGGSQLSQ